MKVSQPQSGSIAVECHCDTGIHVTYRLDVNQNSTIEETFSLLASPRDRKRREKIRRE